MGAFVIEFRFGQGNCEYDPQVGKNHKTQNEHHFIKNSSINYINEM